MNVTSTVFWGLVLVGVGVLQAVHPESALWFQRWQFRRGDEVELSDTYRGMVRAGGVLAALLGVGMWVLTFVHVRSEQREQVLDTQRLAVDEVWGRRELPTDPDTGLRVLDVPVESGTPAPLDEWWPRLDYGVIGSGSADPEVVLDGVEILVFDGANDGDLVLGITRSSYCRVTRVVVEETDSAVTVGVVEVADQTTWQVGDLDPCSPFMGTELDLVHIPLAQPLGDREVLRGRDGNVVAPLGAG